MAPFFTIFQNDRTKLMSAHCIHTIEQYYKVTVDGLSLTIDAMVQKYGTRNTRFFFLDADCWHMFDREESKYYNAAHFALTFDDTMSVSDDDWDVMLKWVECIFNDEKDERLNTLVGELIPREDKCDIITQTGLIEGGDANGVNDGYQFKYIIDESRNMGLFEVAKPFTDRPYCAVVRNFKTRGFLPFFTALYVCNSWGVASHDHLFLLKIWDHLGMKKEHGELNLEERLKEDIEKCSASNPGGAEAEPEVYRMTIDELLEQWSCRQMNKGFVKSDKKNEKNVQDCLR